MQYNTILKKLLLKITSDLKVAAQTKLKILKRYIHSQLQFVLKIYPLGTTWIEQNMDAHTTHTHTHPTCKILAGYANQFLHQRSYGTPCGEMWSEHTIIQGYF